MKTDIQIAQEAEMLHIREVAAKVGIEEEDLEFYGKYKAKLSDELMERVKTDRWKAGTCYCNQSDSGGRGEDDDYRWTWRGNGKAR
mgnify:CR=1 FL=1